MYEIEVSIYRSRTSIKPKLVNGGIYHICNKGVDGRAIYIENKDYIRFIHDLFEFNDTLPANNNGYNFSKGNSKNNNLSIAKRKRKLLVEILAFCLMPNHFHLLIKQVLDNGISKFMQKLGTGYTHYFNKKHSRKGVLFQGRPHINAVDKEEYFEYVPHYIHSNPLDLIGVNWREAEIRDVPKALKFLSQYRWSSYMDYIGKRNFPSITHREFILNIFNGPDGYQLSIKEFLDYRRAKSIEPIEVRLR